MHAVAAPPRALPAAVVVGQTPSLREPRLLDGVLYWLEQRPHEGGRTTLLRRLGPDQAPEELTPGSWNLRSRVHEYGGGSTSLGHRSDGRPVAVVYRGDHASGSSVWTPGSGVAGLEAFKVDFLPALRASQRFSFRFDAAAADARQCTLPRCCKMS